MSEKMAFLLFNTVIIGMKCRRGPWLGIALIYVATLLPRSDAEEETNMVSIAPLNLKC